MSETETILKVDKVSVTYEATPAIKNICLEVKAGEMFGLIGLNGAGKTTLIKTLLSLRKQDEGSVEVFGKPPGEKSTRKHFAFLPERFDPPWFLSGMEFIKMSLQLYGRKFNREEVIKSAESLALDPQALGRRVHTYSKGMRQKLGLMGTLLTECKLMILDEPMSGLDPRARALVKDTLMSAKKQDQTIFLSSHILADMEEICDRVAVLHDSEIMFVGKPNDLIAQTNSGNLERAFLDFIEKKHAA